MYSTFSCILASPLEATPSGRGSLLRTNLSSSDLCVVQLLDDDSDDDDDDDDNDDAYTKRIFYYSNRL